MEKYRELRERICEELDEVAHEIKEKRELSDKEIEVIHKLTDIVKNIDKIHMLDEDGYSGAGEWEAKGHFGDEYARHHDGGSSYARGRKRDSMGRYSRDSRRMNDGRYSRDDGKEHMISKLEDMLDDVDNDRVKSAIHKVITELEKG